MQLQPLHLPFPPPTMLPLACGKQEVMHMPMQPLPTVRRQLPQPMQQQPQMPAVLLLQGMCSLLFVLPRAPPMWQVQMQDPPQLVHM